MGATIDTTAEIPPHLRHRAGLACPQPLAGNPAGGPRFVVQVRRADGSSLAVADPKTTRLAVALMDMNAVHGGAACHWGGPSAFAEIMSSIHGLMFAAADWRKAFNFVNDAGHCENGVYALKANYGQAGLSYDDLKGFRSIKSRLTGHGESHLFAQGVMISNGPLGSGLPIAQGLAMADRLADLDRVTIAAISDGAMMEGEAKEAVAAIPGFAGRGLLNPFVMVLSDNDTKLSGRIGAMSFPMRPSFESLSAQGWAVIRVADGHDLQAVFTAIEQAIARAKADPKRAVAVWCTTIKGKGVKKTEINAAGGHGYPLKHAGELRPFVEEINGGPLTVEPFKSWLEALEAEHQAKEAKKKAAPAPAAPAAKTDKVQAGFPEAMIAAAEAGLPVVSVGADLMGSTGTAPFHAKFPQFSFDVGVSESNMVSVATGFAKQGYLPVVDTFAQFGITKGNLPLCMGVLSQSPCLAVFSHCGFQDAADGASHQALYYLAATSAIPHLEQYCPATAEEARWAMDFALRRMAEARKAGHHPASVLFFCGRENFPLSLKPAAATYAWGKAMVLADTTAGRTRSVVISACGWMASLALKAQEALAKEDLGAIVLQNSTPNRPDTDSHAEALRRCGGRLITVEDHQAIGGAGEMLAAALVRAGQNLRHELLAVHGEFGQSAYLASELYDRHGLGPAGIAEAARRLVR